MLFTSIFLYSHNILKGLFSQGQLMLEFCGKVFSQFMPKSIAQDGTAKMNRYFCICHEILQYFQIAVILVNLLSCNLPSAFLQSAITM